MKKNKTNGNIFIKIINKTLGGRVLETEGMLNQIPYMFFILLLGVVYISNRNYSIKIVKEIDNIQKQIKELKYEQIVARSELMNISKQSVIANVLSGYGIKESKEPPVKIIVHVNK